MNPNTCTSFELLCNVNYCIYPSNSNEKAFSPKSWHWNFFHLFGKLKDNKTDVDLKWILWFFLFFFFFYTVSKLDQAKLIKDPEWIYMYFKKTLPQKNTKYWKEKKTLKNSKGCKNFSRTHCYPWKIQQFWNLLASRWATSSILNHRTSRYHQPTEELV